MLYKIFKKTKISIKNKRQIKKTKIIIDIHEKNSLVPSYLKELNSIIEFKKLDVGDYLINNIAIERKTNSDFISSMLNKRIITQLNNLKKYKKFLLIIECLDLKNLEKTKIKPNAIKGFLLSISLNYNIPVIQTQDQKQTAEYLNLLAKQQIKKQEISLHSRIPKTIKEQQLYVLQSFPNIGPKKSKLLIDKFKSLKNIVNATELELKPILGKRTYDLLRLLEFSKKRSNFEI